MKRRLFLGLLLGVLSTPIWAVAPTYVANATDSSTSDIATHTVNLPTHSNGDLLVLCFGSTHTSDPAESVDTPSGWTLEGTGEEGTTSAVRLSAYSKLGNGSETTVDVTFTSPATSGFTSVALSYSGASSTIDVVGLSTETGTVNAMIAPAVTTTVADTIVIRCNSSDDDDPTSTNWDDNLTTATARNYVEMSTPGNGMWTAAADNTQAGIGTTGTEQFTNGSTSEHHKAITMAFGPSGAAPTRNRIRIIN